jgi:hypothetical protein
VSVKRALRAEGGLLPGSFRFEGGLLPGGFGSQRSASVQPQEEAGEEWRHYGDDDDRPDAGTARRVYVDHMG